MNTAPEFAAFAASEHFDSFVHLVSIFVPRHVAAGLSFEDACTAAIADAGAWAARTRNNPAAVAELVALAKR